MGDSVNSIMVTLMTEENNGTYFFELITEIAEGEFNHHICKGTIQSAYSPKRDNEMAIQLKDSSISHLQYSVFMVAKRFKFLHLGDTL